MTTLTRITADDFEKVAAVLGPCELVEGEVVRMSPGGIEHSRTTARITFVLESHARQARSGRVLTNEAGIVVKQDPDTVRGADVLYVSYARLPQAQSWPGFLRVPPELLVEVFGADESWARMEAKVAEYHAFGVDMVWVADPRTLAVRLYPKGGAPSVRHGGDELTGEGFLPGFRCVVSAFFTD